MVGGRKVFYVLGGLGLKPDRDFKIVSPGKFTKGSRNHKATPNK